MFQNPAIRSQRSRVAKLNNKTPNTVNWADISTPVDEEGSTGFVRAVGFTGSTTLLVSVPQNLFFANDGSFDAIVASAADPTAAKSFKSIVVSPIGTSVTAVPITPGDWVGFYATCSVPFGPLTVTVTDYQTNTVIDTFTITVI